MNEKLRICSGFKWFIYVFEHVAIEDLIFIQLGEIHA
jgi:hypothetical protein